MTLPNSREAPPIITICFIRGKISGALCSADAILVKGPSVHSETDFSGRFLISSITNSTALMACNGTLGSETSMPSSPLWPWTASAVTAWPHNGASQPANTGTSKTWAISQMKRALRAVNANGTFPATAVIPNTFSSLRKAKASIIATASSCPGSVSIIICCCI